MHRFASKCAMLVALGLASLSQVWAGPVSFTETIVTSPGVALVNSDYTEGEYESFQSYISTEPYFSEVVSRSDPFDFFVDEAGQAYAYQDVTRRYGRDVTASFALQNYATGYYWFSTEEGTGFNYVELSIDLQSEASSYYVYAAGNYGEVSHPRTGAEAKVMAALALDGDTLNTYSSYGYEGYQWYANQSGGALAEGEHMLSVDNFPGGTVNNLYFTVYSQPYEFFERSYFEGYSYTNRELILVTSMPVPEPTPLLLTLAGCAVALRLRKRTQAA